MYASEFPRRATSPQLLNHLKEHDLMYASEFPPRATSLQLLKQSKEHDLRLEIQQCQRSLIRAQAETRAAEGQAQEVEEAHQQELAVLCAQLDVLDRHLLAEHEQQSEESHIARTLLETAQEQLGQMHEELRSAQQEAEFIETEFSHGRPQVHLLSMRLQRSIKEEHDFESEVESLSFAAGSLRRELASRASDRAQMGERQRYLEEALERASGQIANFEHWSDCVHEELRQVASELHEDQLAGDLERQRLQARIAELEMPVVSRPETGLQDSGANGWHHEVDSPLIAQAEIGARPRPAAARDSNGQVAPSEHPARSPGPVIPPTFQSPTREVAQGIGTSQSPAVLWCRKAPSNISVLVSPSAPSLT